MPGNKSRAGVHGLNILKIKHVFVTHLHSDHAAGYPDIIFTPWTLGRPEDDLLMEIRERYNGKVVSGKDLEVY